MSKLAKDCVSFSTSFFKVKKFIEKISKALFENYKLALKA
jgi:hypothetical protein